MLFVLVEPFSIQDIPDASKLLAEQTVAAMDALRQASVPMSLESALSIGTSLDKCIHTYEYR